MRELSKDLQLDIEWHGQTGKVITHKEAVEVGEDLDGCIVRNGYTANETGDR